MGLFQRENLEREKITSYQNRFYYWEIFSRCFCSRKLRWALLLLSGPKQGTGICMYVENLKNVLSKECTLCQAIKISNNLLLIEINRTWETETWKIINISIFDIKMTNYIMVKQENLPNYFSVPKITLNICKCILWNYMLIFNKRVAFVLNTYWLPSFLRVTAQLQFWRNTI